VKLRARTGKFPRYLSLEIFKQRRIFKIELRELIKREIKKLKEPYKQVIQMREIDGMKYQEISDELNTNLSTIKSRIKKSRELLIKRTEKEFKLIEIS
jgi:RNA polymerase sigma factor (sigma-70 family)